MILRIFFKLKPVICAHYSIAMKAIFILMLSCFLASVCRSQKIDSAALSKLSPDLQKQVNDHLQNSKKAKAIAFSLLAGGVVFETVGIIIAVNDANNDSGGNAEGVAALFGFTGAAAILGSIPFFIKSHRQKEMARILVYGDKPVSMAPGMFLPNSNSYGLRLVVPLGK
jgi:hypothetical protein